MITEGRSVEWVKRLPAVVKAMNIESVKITGKRAEVKQFKTNYKRVVGLDEERLPPGVKVRFLFNQGEDEGGEKRRATDPTWSLETYGLSRSVVSADQPVLYYLSRDGGQDGGKGARKRSFVCKEPQVVPEDKQLPPDSVL